MDCTAYMGRILWKPDPLWRHDIFSVGLFYIIGAGSRRQMDFLCIGIEHVSHLL